MTEIPRRRSDEKRISESFDESGDGGDQLRSDRKRIVRIGGDLLRARGAGGFFERVGHAFDDRFPGPGLGFRQCVGVVGRHLEVDVAVDDQYGNRHFVIQ